MKNSLILFFALLLSGNAFAQIEFDDAPESFSHKHYKYNNLDTVVNKKFNLQNDFDFEFRLWEIPSLTPTTSVFIMRLSGERWTAHYFQLGSNNNWSQVTIDEDKLADLWKSLVQNKVLTLPDQSKLDAKMRFYHADTTNLIKYPTIIDPYMVSRVSDGALYWVQLRTNNKQRAYFYHCPQTFLKSNTNVEELYRAFAIIVLVRRYMGRPMTCC